MSFNMKSNFAIRTLTAVPLGIIVLIIIAYADNIVFGFTTTVFSILGIIEYYKMINDAESSIPPMLMPVIAALMGISSTYANLSGLQASLLIAFLLICYHFLFRENVIRLSGLQGISLTLMGIIWIPWCFSHIILIRELPEGIELVFLLIIIIWTNDTAAYLGGKLYGKRLLAPEISPKKTREGFISGLFASGIFGAVFSYFCIDIIGLWFGFLIGIILAVSGQIGDLFESKIKRICNIKDSGIIIPGHGGILDRIDGLLPSIPIFYYIIISIGTIFH